MAEKKGTNAGTGSPELDTPNDLSATPRTCSPCIPTADQRRQNPDLAAAAKVSLEARGDTGDVANGLSAGARRFMRACTTAAERTVSCSSFFPAATPAPIFSACIRRCRLTATLHHRRHL